jgi:hypothetical protein
MNRAIVWIGVLVMLVVAPPIRALAHPGHDHTVMGTVKSVKEGHVAVEAKEGKVTTFMLSATTKILRGKEKATAADIKVGERVVAIGTPPEKKSGDPHGEHGGEMLNAKEIRLAAAS